MGFLSSLGSIAKGALGVLGGPAGMGIGMGIDAISGLVGANNQNKTNQQNFNAAQQNQQYMQGMVGQYLQPGQNQYANMLSQFIGGGNQGGFAAPQSSGMQYGGGLTSSAMGGPNYNRSPGGLGMIDLGGGAMMNSMQPQAQQQGMYQYQNPGAFLAQANTLGQAPMVDASQIGAMPQLQAQNVNGGQIGALPQVYNQNVQAQQIGGVPQVNAQQVMAATGTQGFNAGQDGLMQLLNKQIQPNNDPTLNLNLQSMANGGESFDNSDLFKALGQVDQQGTEQQVGALHGAAGSLGERFGTAMNQNEAMLRGNIQNNLNARNAQIQQSSYENMQNRRVSALGQMGTMDQANQQLALGNYGLNLNAANSLQSNSLQGTGLDLQAQLGNAGNSLQAQQANLGANLQSQQLNQSTNLAAQQGNAQLGMQGQQFNVGNLLQSSLANQQNQLAAQQFNSQYGLQAQQGNLSAMMQAALANQQTGMQGQIANQNMLGQYGMANANMLNQNSQFNAGQQTNNSQFAAQQGNAYNQYIMQALMGAGGMQQSQNSYNAGLLGILGGVGVPQQQASQMPGAIGNAASTLAMAPTMYNMLQQFGQQPQQQFQPSNYQPVGYSPNQVGSFNPNAWSL